MDRIRNPLLNGSTRDAGREIVYIKALAQCSRALIAMPVVQGNRHDELVRGLGSLRVAARACRTYIFQVADGDPESTSTCLHAEAHRPYIPPRIPFESSGTDLWPSLLESSRQMLLDGRPISGPWQSIFANKYTTDNMRQEWDRCSVLLLPVQIAGEWWGCIGFEDCRRERQWTEHENRLLRDAAELFGNTLQRWQITAELEEQGRLQKALAQCSQLLLGNPHDRQAREDLLDSALEIIRVALKAARAYFFQCVEDTNIGMCIRTLSMVCMPGIVDQIAERNRRGLPYADLPESLRGALTNNLPFGGPIVELLADAPDWVQRYQQQVPPLLSVQLVPLHVDGVLWGYIGVDDVVTARRWRSEEIAMLGTASEILGSTMQRWQVHEQLETEVLRRTLDLKQKNELLEHEIRIRKQTEQNLLHRLEVQSILNTLSHLLLEQELSPENWRKVLQYLGQIVRAEWMLMVQLTRQSYPTVEQAIQWHSAELPDLNENYLAHFLQECRWIRQEIEQGNALHLGTEDVSLASEEDWYLLQQNGAREVDIFPIVLNDHIWTLVCVNPSIEIDHESAGRELLPLGVNLIESKLRTDQALRLLEERLLTRNRELAALFDISLLASQAESLLDLLMPVIERIADIVRCQIVTVHLGNSTDHHLMLAAQQGLSITAYEQIADLSQTSSAIFALTEKQALICQLPDTTCLPEILRLPGCHYFLGCQLQVRGQPIGLLSAYRAEDSAFSIDDISLLTVLSELLATVIENHQLHQEIKQTAVYSERQRLARELHDSVTQSLYSQTIFARSSRYALEDRDYPKLHDNLQQLESGARNSLKEMRLLLFQMQPAMLTRL